MTSLPAHSSPLHTPAEPRAGTRLLLRTGPVALIFGAWWFASHTRLVSPFLLPPPETVALSFVALTVDGTLWRHALVSLGRVVLGFGLSAALALPLAIVFALLPRLRDALEPPLEFLRQIPPLAMVPLLILWLGIGEAQKIGIIVLACFFPIFLGALSGLAQSDTRLIEVGRVCGLSRMEIVRRIVLPDAAASIVTGLRIGLGYSWRALVGAELIAASAGLGYLIVDAQNLARTDIVLVGVVVIGALGLAAEGLARLAVRRFVPWARSDRGLGGD